VQDEGAARFAHQASPAADRREPAPGPAMTRYRRADLSSFEGVIKPAQFYDPAYDPVLRALAAHVVRMEAPIRDDILVERIARAHGFARSGRLIRDRILTLRERPFVLCDDPAGGCYVWPDHASREGWSRLRVPATDEDVRAVEDICSEELRAGAMAIEAEDIPWELSKQLGIRRLSAAARARISRALSAVG
jgi:hypothetical protein